MKIYHYADIERWNRRTMTNKRTGEDVGLKPRKRMGKDDEKASETLGLFGLFSPQPKEWFDNQDFPQVWLDLKSHVGSMLVEIEVDENDPDVYVVDWAPREYFLLQESEGRKGEQRRDAEAAYMDSMIKLKDYLARREVLNYSLPEVVFTKEVKPEQIKVSETQPLLEEELSKAREGSEWRRSLERDISLVPELQAWYQKYREAQEPKSEHGVERR